MPRRLRPGSDAMAELYCYRCLLPVSMCAHKVIADRRSRTGPPADLTTDWAAMWRTANPEDGLGPWIEARWSGVCRGCGERWEPGEAIRRDAGEDGYLCSFCGG